ncbi:aldo/keto reductase [Pseudoalteromonas distincta]|uniref:aldo/keto reductase n=1 Tax=Pseudoalteromonas distincta TaxID=77608 RepID=UPI0032E1E206
MKLALGTAQFGLNYGISNDQGQVNVNEIKQILTLAKASCITTLDTALAYGNSEKSIGTSGFSNHFSVITKISANSHLSIEEQVKLSLSNLQCEELDAVLFHDIAPLLNNTGENHFSKLEALKDTGIIKRIGVSVYTPEQLSLLSDMYNLDIVQAPLNWLDQRFIQPEVTNLLINKNIKLHARSIFLQGLLLQPEIQKRTYFSKFVHLFSKYNAIIKELECDYLTFALAIVVQKAPHIERAVIGCCSKKQLTQLIQCYADAKNLKLPPDDILNSLATSELTLINPSLWVN